MRYFHWACVWQCASDIYARYCIPLRQLRASGRNFSNVRTAYNSILLVRSTFHQHEFHLSNVYGFCGNYSGCVFLKNDRLVFYESEQLTVELYALLLSLNRFGQNLVNRIMLSNRQFSDAKRRPLV